MYKNITKIMIVVWSVIAVGLAGLLIYGISTGQGVQNIFSIGGFNMSPSKVQKEESVSIDGINKISLDFSSSDIEIIPTDEADLKVIQKADNKLKENDKFVITKNENTIEVKKNRWNIGFNIFNFSFGEKIEVYIPKSYNKDLDAKLSSGNMIMNSDITLNNINYKQSSGNFQGRSNITANQITLKSSSGNINIDGLFVKSYDISQTSGNTEIKSLSGSGEIQGVSGNIKVNYKDISDYTDVKITSGNVKITLPKEMSFNFEGHSTSGNINSDFDMNYKDKRGSSGVAKVGDGPYKKISANTVSGNISISRR